MTQFLWWNNFLNGREFTVSVLDGKALAIIEIRPHSGEYDYASNIQPVLLTI